MFAIQYLNFHSHISCVSFHWGTYTDAIVCTWSQLEFEAEDKVVIFILCIQVTTEAFAWVQRNTIILQCIVYRITGPFMHIGTVK